MSNKKRMVVGICGFGYSGSGAVLDWLKGYPKTDVVDSFEFSFLYTPDGILDLKYHLLDNCAKYMSSDIAISRFIRFMKKKSCEMGSKKRAILNITSEYVKSLIQVEWRGYWMFDYYTGSFLKRNVGFRLFHSRIYRMFPLMPRRHPKFPPMRTMYLSIAPESFYEKTKKYIDNLIDLFVEKESTLVALNQPFPANQPNLCLELIDYSKAIVVDRDPRDLYVLFKKVIPNKSCFVPVDSVESFIAYFKALHFYYPRESNNVLVIKFEDLIYEFDNTIALLESFLGLERTSFDYSKTKFNPFISLENTQLFNKYPDLKNDIATIEQQLSEWLYDFDKKQIKPTGDKTFLEIVKLADK